MLGNDITVVITNGVDGPMWSNDIFQTFYSNSKMNSLSSID